MAGIISVIGPEKRIELNAYDVDAWNILLRENTVSCPISSPCFFSFFFFTPGRARVGRKVNCRPPHLLQTQRLQSFKTWFQG